MRSRFFVIGFVAPMLVWACASSDPAPSSSNDALTGSDKSSTSSPSTSASAPSTAGSGAAPSASGSAAPGKPGTSSGGIQGKGGAGGDSSNSACYDACDQQHPAGAKIMDQLPDPIACQCGPNACGPQCGQSMMCSDDDNAPDPTDACIQCLTTNAAAVACDKQAMAPCDNNQDCSADMDCYDACDQKSGN
jgi:hypothetical protein